MRRPLQTSGWWKHYHSLHIRCIVSVLAKKASLRRRRCHIPLAIRSLGKNDRQEDKINELYKLVDLKRTKGYSVVTWCGSAGFYVANRIFALFDASGLFLLAGSGAGAKSLIRHPIYAIAYRIQLGTWDCRGPSFLPRMCRRIFEWWDMVVAEILCKRRQ